MLKITDSLGILLPHGHNVSGQPVRNPPKGAVFCIGGKGNVTESERSKDQKIMGNLSASLSC